MVRATAVALAVALAAPESDADVAPADDGGRKIVGVVTFDGSSAYGAPLSLELSAALRRRGHWARGGRSLRQVKNELACTNYEVACMSKAADLFGSDYVLYGTLRAQGKVHQLEMFLLDAEAGEVQSHVSAMIPEYDLSDGSIEAKATQLLGQLWPEPGDAEAFVPPPLPPPPREEVARDVPKWGYQKGNVDRWKWGGVGASAGMTVIGLVTVGVAAAKLRPGGPLEERLFQEAAASLTDASPRNDIDPDMGGDLCARAEAPPSPEEPDRVTNRAVAVVCREARLWEQVNTGGIIVMVAGAVGLAVFVPLLFYNGPNSKAMRARVKATHRGLALRF